MKDSLVIAAVYAKQQQLIAMVQFNPQAVVDTGKQLDELGRRANLDALRLRAKTNADPRRHKQLKEVQAKQGRDRKDLQLQTRIRDAQEQARQAQEEEIRQARQAQEEEIRQAQAQAAQAAQAEREEAERLERRLYRDLGRQRRRFNTTLGDRYVKPQGQPFRQQQGQRNPDFFFFEEELRNTWSQAEQADAERAVPAPQSPPRAATRAVPVQAPAPVAQPFVATQDDSNLGSLETWDAISKTRIKWDNISGIQGLVGSNNNNTVASVMLFLYLRDNYTPQMTIKNMQDKHFGYSKTNFDELVRGLKKEVFQKPQTMHLYSMGEEFFKTKDDGSNVYSISRMTLLRQRLNRIFFFLAKYHKARSYFGYKQSSGTGYDLADMIGMTREDFQEIGTRDLKMTTMDNVDIPYFIKKAILKWLSKNAPDKVERQGRIDATKAGQELNDEYYENVLDFKIKFATFNVQRMFDMRDNFSVWYATNKGNQKKLLDDVIDPFFPVEHQVDWQKYEDGAYNKDFYDVWLN